MIKDIKEKKVLNLIKYIPVLLVVVTSLITTNIFIQHQKKYLQSEIEKLEINYVSENKKRVQSLVTRVHSYIQIEKKEAKTALKKHLKEESHKVHKIATNIYYTNQNQKNYSKNKTIKQIKALLKAENNDSFTHTLQEVNFSTSVKETIKEKNTLFEEYHWHQKTKADKPYQKMVFYRYFEPYNLLIASEINLLDFEKNLQSEIVKKLNLLKIEKPEHIFIYDAKGVCLVNPKKELIGVNRYNATNANGVHVLRGILEFALKNSEGFIKYKGSVLLHQENKTNDKISFVKLYDEWQWTIGSGFYLEQMYQHIQEKKDSLTKSSDKAVLNLIYISVLVTALMIIISFYLSFVIKKIFFNYKMNLVKKEAEKREELYKNAKLYEDLFETNKSIILLINPVTGSIINANQSALNFYGYTKVQFLSMNINQINTLSNDEIKKELEAAKSLKRNYFKFIHKLSNGELRHVRVTSSIAQYLNKDILYSVIIDATEEFEIKEQLTQSKDEFQKLFEFSNIGFAIFNTEGEFIRVNKKLLEILGYKETVLLNSNYKSIALQQDSASENRLFKRLVNKEITNYNIEKTLIKQDGSTFQAMLTMATIVNKKGELTSVLCSIIDISELKEKEKLLIQQSKMATMGEMLASIAHQWKQPITTISAAILPMKMSLELEEEIDKKELEENIEMIEIAINNITHTIDDFRNFFNPRKERTLFKVSMAFDETFNLISSQLKNNNIEIIKDIQEVELYGSQNELQQILINILKNAKEELEQKDAKEKRYIFLETNETNNNLIIKIRDNAGGIPKEIIDDVFDAYFTTKEKQNGTGIGLYMSKQIVEGSMKGRITLHNAEFTYDNTLHKGAEFVITIPKNLRANRE